MGNKETHKARTQLGLWLWCNHTDMHVNWYIIALYRWPGSLIYGHKGWSLSSITHVWRIKVLHNILQKDISVLKTKKRSKIFQIFQCEMCFQIDRDRKKKKKTLGI